MKFLADLVVRRSKTIFFGFVALIALSATLGLQSFSLLTAGGYENSGSDSAQVNKILKEQFKQAQPELVGILDQTTGEDNPMSYNTGYMLQSDLERVKGVDSVVSYFSVENPIEQKALQSKDGRAVYFFIDLNDKVNQAELVRKIQNKFTGSYNDAMVYFAGSVAVTSEINSIVSSDITTAETFAIPIVIILMLFVFGSLVAAGLPLLVGGLGIVGSFFFIWLSAQFGDTSVFAINMVTGMGLGLGIDYALLMVNRFREERLKQPSVADAVRETVLTAGRTVFFSGMTVAIVIAALLFFPQGFLRSMAFGGVAVVAVCLGGALLALPALLNMLGDNIERFRIFKIRKEDNDADGAWSDIAQSVMAKPLRYAFVSLVLLGSLASLIFGAKFGQVDDRILPADNRVVTASNIIRERFEGRESQPIEILVKGGTASEIEAFTKKLSETDHILKARSTAGIFENGKLIYPYNSALDSTVYEANGWKRILATHNVESRSPAGYSLTVDVRNLNTSDFDKVLIGGSAAVYTDSQQAVENNLPAALIWISLSTIILLFLFTGSILLPIKAVLLNFLSLTATIGFLTWVFVDGNLRDVIGDFQVTGTLDTSVIVLIAVLTFGLSMDYELFLLSRIKEEHEAGAGTVDSVANGLQKSGRIITAAALVLAVSFIGFISSGISMIKMMGLGIAFAIILDATIVRALLVPALMRLFGQANWWAPKWAKKIADKIGFAH